MTLHPPSRHDRRKRQSTWPAGLLAGLRRAGLMLPGRSPSGFRSAMRRPSPQSGLKRKPLRLVAPLLQASKRRQDQELGIRNRAGRRRAWCRRHGGAPPTRRAAGAYRWINSLQSPPNRTGGEDLKPSQRRNVGLPEGATSHDPRLAVFFGRPSPSALWRATAGSAWGGELFDRWSQRHESYDDEVTADRWEGFERSPVSAEVYGDPNALAALLTPEGLRLADAAPQTRATLSTLLLQWTHPDRRTVAATPGWTHDFKVFLLEDGRVIGDQTVVLGHRAARRRDEARGASRQGASVAALSPVIRAHGVSAPSRRPARGAKIESGIVHLSGNSSRGKTTALRAAVSAWGPPSEAKRSWRATTNGLEGIAAAHNSTLLTLDELHQVAAKEAGPAALMLANGEGKIRADQHGESRRAKTWCTLVLSSGECSLADRITASGGRRITAGQEVRFLNLKADERAFGCFDDLHDEADGKAFAERLAAACEQAYGTAGPAFVEFVMRTA